MQKCKHTHIRKTGPAHDKFIRLYRKQVIPMHRAVLSWLRLIDKAVLYGLDQQLIRGYEADTSAATKYEAYNPSPIEKRFIELRAKQLAESFNEVQKAKPPFTGIVTKLADWNCIRMAGDSKIGPHHMRIYGKAGQAAGQLARLSISWDVVNKKAVKWAIKNTNELVTMITDQTREGLRVIISSGINRGRSMAEIARAIRRTGSVGLNGPQAKAIVNFETNLLNREAIIKQALKESNNSLTGAQDWLTRKHWKIPQAWIKQVRDKVFDINARVAKKTKTMLRYRSEMIARTETARAMSEGSLEIYTDAGLRYVIFDSSADACLVCGGYDGNRYTIGEAGGIIPVHPNCFIDQDLPIVIYHGVKKLASIQVGDLVLTHKGNYKKVIELHRITEQCPDIVEFTVKKIFNKTIRMTSNHPVLLNGHWEEAKNIQIGDRVRGLSGEKSGDGFKDYWVSDVCKYKLKTPVILYNLSVEEDESYIAKGFVVHNCRCSWRPPFASELK